MADKWQDALGTCSRNSGELVYVKQLSPRGVVYGGKVRAGFVEFADFHGVNTPTTASFKLPT